MQMSKSDMLVFLLSSYIINFPIIRSWGMNLKFPLALVAEDKTLLEDCISKICHNSVRIFLSDGVPRMKKKISENNTFAVFLDWGKRSSQNEKDLMKFDTLETLASTQKSEDGHKLDKPIFLVCTCIPDSEQMERMVIVNLPNAVFSEFEIYDFIPDAEDLTDIKCEIVGMSSEDEIEQAFIAAACFLKPKLLKQGKERQFHAILEYAKELAQIANDVESADAIVEFFSDFILDKAESGEFYNRIKLPYLSFDDIAKLDKGLFVDCNLLYMSEHRFAELCEEIKGFISLSSIKQALKEADVIKCDGGGYTKKMNYVSVAGTHERKRMLCIDTSLICSRDKEIKLNYFTD